MALMYIANLSVKDSLGWSCWYFQKTKKFQKQWVLNSNVKLALFPLLALGQNNQAFMNFIWDNFYQRVWQDVKGIVVRRLIRKTPCWQSHLELRDKKTEKKMSKHGPMYIYFNEHCLKNLTIRSFMLLMNHLTTQL